MKFDQNKWKPVALTESLISKGIEGLIGIEELTDYSVVGGKQNTRKKNYGDEYVKKKNHGNLSVENEHASKKRKKKDGENGDDCVEPLTKKNKFVKEKKNEKLNDGNDHVPREQKKKDGEKGDSVEPFMKKKKKRRRRRRKDVNASFKKEGEKEAEGVKEGVSESKKALTKKRKKRRRRRRKDVNASFKKEAEEEEVEEEKEEASESEEEVVLTGIEEQESDFSELQNEMIVWNQLGVPVPILRALAEQGFKSPTEIQARTLPAAIMGRRDILGAAETGSGKTLAFGIPILNHILRRKNWTKSRIGNIKEVKEEEEKEEDDDDEDDNVEEEENDREEEREEEKVEIKMDFEEESSLCALVLTPTRELAIQINNHLKAAAKYTDIQIAVVVGGMSIQKQERLLNRKPEIVVATPGRLWELIQDGNAHLANMGNIRYLAVDETDRMLEKGHFQELKKLLELLNIDEGKKRRRQNFVFSATLTMVHETPKHLKGKKGKFKITPGQKLQSIMNALGVTNPKVVDVTKDSGMAGTLTEARIMCELEEKDFFLYYFLQRHRGRTLIFCNSISCVRRLAQLLSLLKCQPLPLHANMMQRQRLKNLDRFRENPYGVLLATDVAARGLDIPDVQHVVHYQVPRTSEGYVHRSGRTARAQKEGLTLLLIEPTEAQCYLRLCHTLGRTNDLPIFPIDNGLLILAKKRVALARELDQLELVSRRSSSETGWFQKALTEMDMLVDEHDLPRQMDEEQFNRNRRIADVKKKQLNALLAKPLFSMNGTEKSIDILQKNDEKSKKQQKKNVFVKKKNNKSKK